MYSLGTWTGQTGEGEWVGGRKRLGTGACNPEIALMKSFGWSRNWDFPLDVADLDCMFGWNGWNSQIA